jgi:hypothetical protein
MDKLGSRLLARKRGGLAGPALHPVYIICLLAEFAHVGGQASLHRICCGFGSVRGGGCDCVFGGDRAAKPARERSRRDSLFRFELFERIRPSARNVGLGTTKVLFNQIRAISMRP